MKIGTDNAFIMASHMEHWPPGIRRRIHTMNSEAIRERLVSLMGGALVVLAAWFYVTQIL